MAFKKDRAEEQLEGRLNEILNACATIYGEKGFDAVTVKAIAERTSFSRVLPSTTITRPRTKYCWGF